MKEPVSMHRLSEDTIARALYYVRAEIIRDGLDGQEHVDALLTLRGHDPERFHVPAKLPRTFKGRGKRQRAVMAALKQGPCTSRQVAAKIAAESPDQDAGAIWRCVTVCLAGLRNAGVVVKGSEWPAPAWRLAP